MEWESYSSIYSSSEAEVFEAGTILPKMGPSGSTLVENLPGGSLTTGGLANSQQVPKS